jgi:hypothetical protein
MEGPADWCLVGPPSWVMDGTFALCAQLGKGQGEAAMWDLF